MKYYIHIKDNQIIAKANVKCLNEDILNVETTKEIFNNIDKYIYKDNEIILDPDYEQKQIEKEKQRIAGLELAIKTIEDAIYKVKFISIWDIDFGTIPMSEIKISLSGNVRRDNPYIEIIGEKLNITEMLDSFFESGDYNNLIWEI